MLISLKKQINPFQQIIEMFTYVLFCIRSVCEIITITIVFIETSRVKFTLYDSIEMVVFFYIDK